MSKPAAGPAAHDPFPSSPDISLEKERPARLIVACARLHPNVVDPADVSALARQPLPWDDLILKADEEGVLPLLHRSLSRAGAALPPDVEWKLAAAYFLNLKRNAQAYAALEPFLAAVSKARLRLMMTKGARLALDLYGDIALRPFWDVDFIVHPADWPGVRDALAHCGFEEAEAGRKETAPPPGRLEWTYSPYFRREGLHLEFHFSMFGLHFPAGSEDAIWKAARPLSLGGAEVMVRPLEDELCYLCLHAQQHSYARLIWLTDIAEAVSREGLDWDRVLETCRRERIKGPVHHGLRLVEVLWPGTVRRSVTAAIRPGPFEGTALRFLWPGEAVARREASAVWPYYMPSLFSLWERRSPALALRALSGILFPPRVWMARVCGVSSRSPRLAFHYARRLLRPVRETAWRMAKLR